MNGRGIQRLKDAGIEVDVGLLADEAEEVNLGFFTKLRHNRPMVTLKIASSLDGRIATKSGDSKWITGELARAHGHRLRAIHDAILVGSGTVLADDPELTCRLPGLEDRSPERIILDRRLRISPDSKVIRTAGIPGTMIVFETSGDAGRLTAFRRGFTPRVLINFRRWLCHRGPLSAMCCRVLRSIKESPVS